MKARQCWYRLIDSWCAHCGYYHGSGQWSLTLVAVVCVLSYEPQCYGVGQLGDPFMVVYNEAVLSGPCS